MSNLQYISRPSTLTTAAPLLIMCHGYGSDENDLFAFASELPKELFIISLKAPHAMQPYGNAWYAINFDADQGKWSDNVQAMQSVDDIAKFIDYAAKTYSIDPKNISLLGFSQGSILSYAVALTYPKKVKNIIALSGYINTDLIPRHIADDEISHLNFFCSHGSVDQVIPVDWARRTPAMLKTLNANYVYKEYPVGHGVAPQNFHDFKDWLTPLI